MAHGRILLLAVVLLARPAHAHVKGAGPVRGPVSVLGGATAQPVPALAASAAVANALSPAASVLPSASPALPALPAAQAESVGAALEALAPENAGKISGEDAKTLSGRVLGLEEGGGESSSSDAPTAGHSGPTAPELSRPSAGAAARAAAPRVAAPMRPARPVSFVDHLHHVRLLAQNYYWYSVTNIFQKWPKYKKSWDAAKAAGGVSVSNPRAFFAHMRVAATSGRFYVLGAAPLEEDAVIAALRGTYLKWYDVPGAVGPKELAAFDAFTARAKAYNSARRAPSNMRKHIRDALIDGATIKPSKLAEFFDSRLTGETAQDTAAFQREGGQERILAEFVQTLRATLAEEPAGAEGRVRAAILLGSFATKSAGPKSDFDVEIMTDGGSRVRSDAFIKRLTERWKRTGQHGPHPVIVHDFPSIPSRGIVDLVHTGDFIAVSLEPEIEAQLQRKPGEYVPGMVRADTARGRLNRAVHYSAVAVSTYLSDLKGLLGSRFGGR